MLPENYVLENTVLKNTVFTNIVFEVEQFFLEGGWVLYVLALLALLMNILLLERLSFKMFCYKALRRKSYLILDEPLALQQKMSVLCDLDLALKSAFPMIKTLIAISPLVGLLGTVSGMIQVFDSLAIFGTGNQRMMASGIARATLPTMVGMTIAVTGLMVYARLWKWVENEQLALLNLKSKIRGQ